MTRPDRPSCLWCSRPGADSTFPSWSGLHAPWPIHARCRPAAEAFRKRYFPPADTQAALPGMEAT